jgi:UDP-glucose 4-epimerase
MTTLVTGATGFVGNGVTERLLVEGRAVRGVTRHASDTRRPGLEWVTISDQIATTDWSAALAGVQVVIHLAARVHVMRETASDPLAEFRRTNVEGTLNLARQAAAAGARRFVFVSSIKVNGEAGTFRETDPPAPLDAYGVSKLEAERGLAGIAKSTGLEVVVVRPPLVYGPGVKANFRALMRAVRRGIPLPFAAIDNRRSLVARDNLVDFLLTCATHPAAAGETFLVSDGDDLSTPELIRRIARAMNRPARLVWVPPVALRGLAAITSRADFARRILGSLQLDITKARSTLGWRPPLTVDEGLRRAVVDPSP